MKAGGGSAETTPDVVVASSGNLGHVYFTSQPDRMTSESIEMRYPGLVETLASHPGIGAVIGRSNTGHVLVRGPRGWLDLDEGQAQRTEALAVYGRRAAEDLRRLDGFPNAGDLILLGAVDPDTGEVTGLEELVGSHGGLGGWQAEPFILSPATLGLTERPPVGAPALYRQLVAWRARLQHVQASPRDG